MATLAKLSTASTAPVRKILVTGANKGIGLHIARRILKDYPDTSVVLGSRNKERGDAALKKLLQEDKKNDGRVDVVELDVTSDNSVKAAAERLRSKAPFYGIVNNAGIGFGRSVAETLDTNMHGTRRVCEAFIPLLDEKCGRVVNIASASGPMFINRLDSKEKLFFTSKDTTYDELSDAMKRYTESGSSSVAYGLSKACVNLYTRQLAKAHPKLVINSCTPGYILTDLTAGMGASTPPEESNCHVAALKLLFADLKGNGRYYGSDGVRSPLDKYRGPGDPEYVGESDDE